MNIGILSSAFGKVGLKELASAIGQYGFRRTQLNLIRITDIDSGPGKLSPGMANYIAEEFDRYNIKIPVLGCYTNLIHPDADVRSAGIRRFKDHLRFARDFGTSVVATETGTLNVINQFKSHVDNQSEANWGLLRGIILELAEEAERWGIHIALEGFTQNVVNTPERMHQLLEEIPCTNLGIVMDPCNYIDESNMELQIELMDHVFRLLGDRILLAHAKDFYMENGKMTQPAAGTGSLDYPHYIRKLAEHKPFVHVYLEHLRPNRIFYSLGVVTNYMDEIKTPMI